jgi:hypothetical protein
MWLRELHTLFVHLLHLKFSSFVSTPPASSSTTGLSELACKWHYYMLLTERKSLRWSASDIFS